MIRHGRRVASAPARSDSTSAAVKSVCGTYGGYQAHYKEPKTEPCDACLHAQAAYVAQWRVRSGRIKTAKVPYALLGMLLAAVPTELEEYAEQVLGDVIVTAAIEAGAMCKQDA